jgi:co-chaperonin GroES (HSP10)
MTNVVVLTKDGETIDPEKMYFPEVPAGVRPFGSRVLVQIRAVRTVTAGGIIKVESRKKTEIDNTCVAKVLAVGPLAYKNRNTLEKWSEGTWCDAGEYVFVPKYGGLRWEKPVPPGVKAFDDTVQYALFDDLNILGSVSDPLEANEVVSSGGRV